METLIVIAVLAILFAVLGVVVFAVLIYYVLALGILALLQYLFFLLVKKSTGKEFELQLNTAGFMIETIILIALFVAYASLPAKPIKIDASECESAYYVNGTTDFDGTGSPSYTYDETIEQLVEELEGLKVSHTLPTTIRYAYPNAKTGRKFDYYYFYDRDGDFMLKVCLYDDIVGVSKKLDGKFSYYNTKDTINTEKIRADIGRTENRLRAKEQYGDMMQAMIDSFQYENGSYTFTVPEFGTSSLNIKIYGNEEVFISKRYKSSDFEFESTVKNDAIYYLSEHTEAQDWQQGGTYSFMLDETTYRGINCIIILDGVEFNYEIPLTDEAFLSDRDNPEIWYYE